MATETTSGLRGDGTPAADIPSVAWAVAAGLADAITAVYDPVNAALTDGLILAFRAANTNATTTPTFAPDGLTPHTIVKRASTALAAGDIVATGEYFVRYNLAHTRWVLLNPVVN